MPEITYKIGDVVRATRRVECDQVRPGDLGVVVAVDDRDLPMPINVRFFLDPDQEEWPVALVEVEPVETPDP